MVKIETFEFVNGEQVTLDDGRPSGGTIIYYNEEFGFARYFERIGSYKEYGKYEMKVDPCIDPITNEFRNGVSVGTKTDKDGNEHMVQITFTVIKKV